MAGLFTTPIHASTRFCAVYGHPIKHSASPALQNAGMAALGLEWRYLAFDVRPEELRQAVAGAQTMGFIGLNLTVPHKLLAYELVDELDDSAKSWGAVNTIRFEAQDEQGAWQPLRCFAPDALPARVRSHGFNTDAGALEQALREDLGLELPGAKVLLLGLGGAGRMAALKLASCGVRELFLHNRTLSKADDVAAEIRRRFPQVHVVVGFPRHPVDLVLNATSLGLKADDPLPLDASHFSLSEARAAYDMIYRPAETPFLRAARAAGCRVANGLGMLLYQGAQALAIWSGRQPPLESMRQALVLNIYGAVH